MSHGSIGIVQKIEFEIRPDLGCNIFSLLYSIFGYQMKQGISFLTDCECIGAQSLSLISPISGGRPPPRNKRQALRQPNGATAKRGPKRLTTVSFALGVILTPCRYVCSHSLPKNYDFDIIFGDFYSFSELITTTILTLP